MLKPRDIANVNFRQAWRGYNQEDVDEFMRKIVGSYEELYQENVRLKEHTGELKLRIDEYSQTETHIDETLSLARQTAADVKGAAEERAKATVAEAEVQAERILRGAHQRVEEHLSRVHELTRQERAFRERFRDLLESYWALLEEERRDAEQLTQSIMTVAGEVAAARDKDDTDEDDGGDGEFAYGAEHGLSEDDYGDEYDLYADDAQPTRRMDAVGGDDGGA